MANITPFLYLFMVALKEALYAALTRPLKLFGLLFPSDGFIIMAQSAGQSTRAQIIDKPTDVAIVIPN